jgi:cysteine desulfurase
MQAYLDNSSTTQVTKEVAAQVMQVMTEKYGNPSSLHTLGTEAEKIMKQSRAAVAQSVGLCPESVIFTSGGTEANNLAFRTAFKTPKKAENATILTSKNEHPSVKEPAKYYESLGARIYYYAQDFVTPGSDPGSLTIASIMHVNNETGKILPISEIAKEIREKNPKTIIHSDCVQSYMKLPIDMSKGGNFENVDMISISGHKIHAPKGTGALIARNPEKLGTLIYGGGQEKGVRSGTENTPGIAGLAAAVSLVTAASRRGELCSPAPVILREVAGSIATNAEKAANLRQTILQTIEKELPDTILISPREASPEGTPGHCSPYILTLSFPGTRGEVTLHILEQSGVYVSTGSACSNIGKKGKTQGSKEDIGKIRISLSPHTTKEETEYATEKIIEAVKKQQALRS